MEFTRRSKMWALGIALGVAGGAYALPRQMVEWTYFQDARFSKEAGFEVRPGCSGRPSPLQGRRTRFAARVADACNGGGGPKTVVCGIDGHVTTCPANICDSHLVNCD